MQSKKKLTYILHSIAVGGVEVALMSAIPTLARQYQLHVVVLGNIDPKMTQSLTEDEKGVFTIFNYPLYLYPLILPKVIKHVLNGKPDFLIASLWRASLVALCVRLFSKRSRFYAFVHNTNFPHRLAYFFIRKAAQKADVVLTDSFATSEYVKKEFRPNAEVKIVSFLTRKTPDLAVRPALTPDQEIRFMFLGRISKTKNLQAAIEVIAALRLRDLNITLDIYGRDDDGSLASLQELVHKLNLQECVHFMGEIANDQKWTLFNKYHFYIQLSLSEGMAMSVTEAMQNGLVCIVSPVGEIVFYTEDMFSAIILDIFKENWEKDIEKIYRTIMDSKLYTELSMNSLRYFSDKKLYKDSLLEQIGS